MALIIQETTDQLSKIRDEIKTVKADPSAETSNTDRLSTIDNNLLRYKADLEKEIKSNKKNKKFKRDSDDYKQERVYPWRSGKSNTENKGNPRLHARGNSVRQPVTSSASSADNESDGTSWSSRASSRASPPAFLGRGRRGRGVTRWKPPHNQEKHAGGVRKEQRHYQTRYYTRNMTS